MEGRRHRPRLLRHAVRRHLAPAPGRAAGSAATHPAAVPPSADTTRP